MMKKYIPNYFLVFVSDDEKKKKIFSQNDGIIPI